MQSLHQSIIQLVQERETQQIDEIQSKLNKELRYLDQKAKEHAECLESIEAFQKSWHSLGGMPDIEILMENERLFEEARKATIEPKSVRFQSVIGKVTRELEVQQISKFILSHMKEDKQTPIQAEIKPEKDRSKLEEISGVKRQMTFNRRDSLQQKGPVAHGASATPGITSSKAHGLRSTSSKPAPLQAEGKASYMQATSSWAKKKSEIIRDKESNEKKQKENPRGFTTLGHSTSLAQNLTSSVAEIHSSRFGGTNSRLGAAGGGSTTRNTRLMSKDKRIHSSLNSNANSNLVSARQKASALQPTNSSAAAKPNPLQNQANNIPLPSRAPLHTDSVQKQAGKAKNINLSSMSAFAPSATAETPTASNKAEERLENAFSFQKPSFRPVLQEKQQRSDSKSHRLSGAKQPSPTAAAGKSLAEMRNMRKMNKEADMGQPDLEGKMEDLMKQLNEQRQEQAPHVSQIQRYQNIVLNRPSRNEGEAAQGTDEEAENRLRPMNHTQEILASEPTGLMASAKSPTRNTNAPLQPRAGAGSKRQKWGVTRQRSVLNPPALLNPDGAEDHLALTSENVPTENYLTSHITRGKPAESEAVVDSATKQAALAERVSPLQQNRFEPRPEAIVPMEAPEVNEPEHAASRLPEEEKKTTESPQATLAHLTTPLGAESSAGSLYNFPASISSQSRPDILSLFNSNQFQVEMDQKHYLYVISGYCDAPLGSVERIELTADVSDFSQ